MGFISRLFLTIFAPLDVFDDICCDEKTSVSAGLPPILFCGLLWAIFSSWLAFDRLSPSFTGNFVPASSYYYYQVYFVVPVLLGGVALFAGLCHTGARWAGGDGTFVRTFSCIAYAYIVPLLFIYLLPEMVLYRMAGFDILARFMKVSGPIALVWMLLLSAVALVRSERISLRGALFVAAPSLLIHGLFVGFFIR